MYIENTADSAYGGGGATMVAPLTKITGPLGN